MCGECIQGHPHKHKRAIRDRSLFKPELHNQFYTIILYDKFHWSCRWWASFIAKFSIVMTSFIGRVDGGLVSLPSFPLSSTFARVNKQQVSLTILH